MELLLKSHMRTKGGGQSKPVCVRAAAGPRTNISVQSSQRNGGRPTFRKVNDPFRSWHLQGSKFTVLVVSCGARPAKIFALTLLRRVSTDADQSAIGCKRKALCVFSFIIRPLSSHVLSASIAQPTTSLIICWNTMSIRSFSADDSAIVSKP